MRVRSIVHKKISRKAGLPPGTLVHIGEKKSEQVKNTVFEYSDDECRERTPLH